MESLLAILMLTGRTVGMTAPVSSPVILVGALALAAFRIGLRRPLKIGALVGLFYFLLTLVNPKGAGLDEPYVNFPWNAAITGRIGTIAALSAQFKI